MTSDEMAGFIDPPQVYSREDVLARPSAVPAQDGVYGWWFRQLPPLVVADECCQHQGMTRFLVGYRRPGMPPDSLTAAVLGEIRPGGAWASCWTAWSAPGRARSGVDAGL